MDYWGDVGDAAKTAASQPEESGHRVTVDIVYPDPRMAGYAGREVEKHAAPVQWQPGDAGHSNGWWHSPPELVRVDWETGGAPASATSDTAWSIGPVDPGTVENQELTGRVLRPGRDPEHAAGPVGAEHFRDELIMQIVQAMGPEYTPEMAAMGLLAGM